MIRISKPALRIPAQHQHLRNILRAAAEIMVEAVHLDHGIQVAQVATAVLQTTTIKEIYAK
jgi:hypothetical protein